MAMTSILARPSALKTRPLIPCRLFMPSPITAMMLTSVREVTRTSSSRSSSSAEAASPAYFAGMWSRSSTATVRECPAEPWEVRMTFTPVLHGASISLRALATAAAAALRAALRQQQLRQRALRPALRQLPLSGGLN